MDPITVCSQEIDAIYSQCPTFMSTLDTNNKNKTHISLPSYHATDSNQLQVQLPIIMPITGPVFLLTSINPASCNNQLQPIFTNDTPFQHVQFPLAVVPNAPKEIDCPPDAIKNKFDLTPEIPEQIFTLPFLELKTSEPVRRQDQNTITSILEQPTEPNKVEELAKRSDYSKKIPLSIEIPDTLPPKSLFPSYSTPPGGIVLRPLKLPPDPLSRPSDVCFGSPFSSPREIHPLGLNAQTTSYGAFCNSPVVTGQATQQPETGHIFTIQTNTQEENPIQPPIQAHIMAPSILQLPFMQNLNVGPQYPETNPAYKHATQYPPTMEYLNTATQYHNINPSLYQNGTQMSLKILSTDTSLVHASSKVTISTEENSRNEIPLKYSTENPNSTSLDQNIRGHGEIDNLIYTSAGNINLIPVIVKNHPSISMCEYPLQVSTLNESTSQVFGQDPNEGSNVHREVCVYE